MKRFPLLLAALLLVPASEPLRADEAGKLPSYQFEFKVAKQRQSRVKKGSSANKTTSEVWNYKIEVENKSLQDVGKLEVKYTTFISTETNSGGSRHETTRKESGDGMLAPILRGNRAILETKPAPVKQSKMTEIIRPDNQRNDNNNTQIKVTEVREKLDGISIQLFLDGRQVGNYVLGDAAKRALLKKKD